jgi:Flp pilus assembly pilin Flp
MINDRPREKRNFLVMNSASGDHVLTEPAFCRETEVALMAFWKFFRNKRGAGMVEYSLLVGLIGVLSIGSIVIMGTTVSDIYCTVANRISGDASCHGAGEVEPPATEVTVIDHLGDGLGGALVGTVSSMAAPEYSVLNSDLFYCIDIVGDVMEGVALETKIVLSDPSDPAMAAYLYGTDSLDRINYMLNQDYGAQGYTQKEVQDAVWFFSDGAGTLSDPRVYEIVEDAYYNGAGYQISDGDIAAVILAPIQMKDADGNDTTNYQNFIYGVPKALLGL